MTEPLPFEPLPSEPLPFQEVARAAEQRAPADEPTYGVGELNRAIADALVEAFPRQVWVRGEVAQLRVSGNGHAYFDLCEKDARRDHVRAKLSVVCWRTDRPVVNRTLRDAGVELADGVELRIRGRVELYPAGGRLQLVMTAVDPVFTVGKLAAQRARVLQVLTAEGLLRRQGELAIPLVPLRVGLVTSTGSAAYHDFVEELAASGHAFRVFPVDVRVQGQGADRRIIYGLNRLAALQRTLAAAREPLDVVVIARGGGARSDLAAFDSEVVARAIAAFPVPVITGIGHEIDRTVADEVAHTCVKTPTAAAALLVGAVVDYRERLARLAHRLSARARSACALAHRDTSDIGRRLTRAAPRALAREHAALDDARRQLAERTSRRVAESGVEIDRGVGRLQTLARRGLRHERSRLETANARLRALDPQRVLERGYTITRTAEGTIVRAAGAVVSGDALVTQTARGVVRSRVVDEEQA